MVIKASKERGECAARKQCSPPVSGRGFFNHEFRRAMTLSIAGLETVVSKSSFYPEISEASFISTFLFPFYRYSPLRTYLSLKMSQRTSANRYAIAQQQTNDKKGDTMATSTVFEGKRHENKGSRGKPSFAYPT